MMVVNDMSELKLNTKPIAADKANPYFSEAERHAYREQGYITAPGMFSAEEAADLVDIAQQLADWPEVAGKYMKYYERALAPDGSKLLRRVENFFDYHAAIADVITSRRIGGAVAELLDEDVYLFKDQLIYKYPGGEGYRYHQDHRAGWNAYADEIIRVIIALDDATNENGCLEIASGLHRQGLFADEWATIADDDAAKMTFKEVPMNSGDAIFFHSFTPHGSGPNLSSRPRRMMSFAFNRASAGDHRVGHYAEKREIYPPDFERDPTKVYKSGAERRGFKGIDMELDTSASGKP